MHGIIYLTLPATDSEITFEEWQAMDEEETEETTYTIDEGYTQQVADITLLLLLMIFFIGITGGLLMGSILWRRIK